MKAASPARGARGGGRGTSRAPRVGGKSRWRQTGLEDQVRLHLHIGDDARANLRIECLAPKEPMEPREKEPKTPSKDQRASSTVPPSSSSVLPPVAAMDETSNAQGKDWEAYKFAKQHLEQTSQRIVAGTGDRTGAKLVDDVKKVIKEAGRLLDKYTQRMVAAGMGEGEPSPEVVDLCVEAQRLCRDCSKVVEKSLLFADIMGPKHLTTLGEHIAMVREWVEDYTVDAALADSLPEWAQGLNIKSTNDKVQRILRTTGPLVQKLQVSPQVLKERKLLLTCLEEALHKFFKSRSIEGMSICMFGSIACKLDTPTSDIDLNVKVDGPIPEAYVMVDGKSSIDSKCWTCGSPDHISKNCPQKGGPGRREVPTGVADALQQQQERELHALMDENDKGDDGEGGEDGNGDGEEELESPGPKIDKKKILLELSKMLKNLRGSRRIAAWAITKARVPLIKVTDYSTGICCDISMESDLSMHKSAFLRSYVKIDSRFRELLALVKCWAKARNINDATSHTLNSFAYTMLVIQFLQTREPPILPCLHAESIEYKGRVAKLPPACASFGSFDIRYHGCDGPEGDAVEFLSGYGQANTATVQELLLGFFHFIAREVDLTKQCVSVREGRVKVADKAVFKHKHSAVMCVEDPFDATDNVARSVTEQSAKRLLTEFWRARFIALATGDMEALCVPSLTAKEAADREREPRRNTAQAGQEAAAGNGPQQRGQQRGGAAQQPNQHPPRQAVQQHAGGMPAHQQAGRGHGPQYGAMQHYAGMPHQQQHGGVSQQINAHNHVQGHTAGRHPPAHYPNQQARAPVFQQQGEGHFAAGAQPPHGRERDAAHRIQRMTAASPAAAASLPSSVGTPSGPTGLADGHAPSSQRSRGGRGRGRDKGNR